MTASIYNLFSLKTPTFKLLQCSVCALTYKLPKDIKPIDSSNDDDFVKIDTFTFNQTLIDLTFWIAMATLTNAFIKKGRLKTITCSTVSGILAANYLVERKRIIPFTLRECIGMVNEGKRQELFDKLFKTYIHGFS